MDASAELTRALAEWRRLTELEAGAILRDDWRGLAEHQSGKTLLRAEIEHALGLTRAVPAAPGGSLQEVQSRFGPVVGELLALENRNREALAAKRRQRKAESERLALAGRDLRCVRRAYGADRAPIWQSYS